jgi:hypothetical protein
MTTDSQSTGDSGRRLAPAALLALHELLARIEGPNPTITVTAEANNPIVDVKLTSAKEPPYRAIHFRLDVEELSRLQDGVDILRVPIDQLNAAGANGRMRDGGQR